jgi:flagellar motor switch protein FliM
MSENEILTSEEKDALDNAAESSLPEENVAEPQFNVVDFSQIQNSISNYPGLQPILELFVLEFTHQFSKFLRRRINVSLGNFQSIGFGQYTGAMQTASIYNLLFIKPYNTYGLIHFPYEFQNFVVMSLFGGACPDKEPLFQGIGKVGQRVVLRILKLIFDALNIAWNEFAHFDFEIVKTFVNHNLITKISRKEMLVIIRYHIQFNGISTWFDIVFPHTLMEQMKLIAQQKEASVFKRPEEGIWHQALREELMNTHADITALLPEINLPLKDVLNLKTGDVIPISDPREVYICSGESKLYRATAGVNGTQRVIKILGFY